MADPPSFLRECDRPLPFRGIAPVRVFELLGSVEDLLHTNNALDDLIQVLLDNDGENAIWLADDIFLDTGLTDTYNICEIEMTRRSRHIGFAISTVQQAPTQSLSTSSRAHIGTVTDTLLRLLAKDATIYYISISGSWRFQTSTSLDALKDFVSEAKCSRNLYLYDSQLSMDQWRVIFLNRNKNVTLYFIQLTYIDNPDIFEAWIEAMNQNRCPTDISLNFDQLYEPDNTLCDFFAALQSTTALQELRIRNIICFGECSIFLPLCEAISQNQSLQYLALHCSLDMDTAWSDSQWERFCSAIASLPTTLQELELENEISRNSKCHVSRKRDRLFIQNVSRNTVLRHFNACDSLFHDYDHVEKAIRPVLNMNRFRPVVEAIKQETDAAHRQQLFSTALLSDQVFKSPAHRFLLFKENSDLLACFSKPEFALFAHWNRLIARVLAVEDQMQNCDLLPPSLEPLIGKKRLR